MTETTFMYEIRNAQGEVCCAGDDENFPRCAACQAKDFDIAIDPYAAQLAAMRAAEATPLSIFEAQWQAARLAELEAEARR